MKIFGYIVDAYNTINNICHAKKQAKEPLNEKTQAVVQKILESKNSSPTESPNSSVKSEKEPPLSLDMKLVNQDNSLVWRFKNIDPLFTDLNTYEIIDTQRDTPYQKIQEDAMQGKIERSQEFKYRNYENYFRADQQRMLSPERRRLGQKAPKWIEKPWKK